VADGPHFQGELFRFLEELSEHNNREWFLAHRERYEACVRDPFLRFIADFAPRLRAISRHFTADPRPSGGSLFRIHRDVRFSSDKRPYKTMAGAQFRHASAGDAHAPGFYLHLEPGRVFAAAGVWRPSRDDLTAIRRAIAEHPARWRRAVRSRAFTTVCTLGGGSLKRPPRGFEADHPLIEDLKRTDFLAIIGFTEEDALAPDFLERFTRACRAAAPLVRFVTKALGLAW